MCRDESDRIERALRSLSFCDEVMVFDSGSTDGSAELAERLGARVVRTDWPGHTEQRRRLIAACAGEWVLTIDADEWVPAPLADEIRAFVAEPDADSASVPRRHLWLGHRIEHGRLYPDRRVRLVRRDKARVVGQNPHDRVEAGTERRLAQDLLHEPYRNLGEQLKTIDHYSAVAAKTARPGFAPFDLAVRPAWHFFRAYVLERGLLDGVPGLVLAALGALYVLLKYARAHGLQGDAP